MLLLLRFGLCLPFQRRVPAKAVTPLYAGLGGRGAGTQPCTLSPPLGRMDLMHILWPPSVHGGILSFTHVVQLKSKLYSSSEASTLLLTGQRGRKERSAPGRVPPEGIQCSRPWGGHQVLVL